MPGSGFMDFVNYNKIANVDNQVLSTFDWDLTLSFPETYAPYYPPIKVIQQRLKSVSGMLIFKDHDPLTVNFRGNTLLFPGMTKNAGGTLKLTFLDFSDLSITTWINDWTRKCNDWETHQSFPKSTVYVNATVYQLDTFRNPVFQWNFKTGIIDSASGDETGKATKDAFQDDITLGIKFEYVDIIPLTATT